MHSVIVHWFLFSTIKLSTPLALGGKQYFPCRLVHNFTKSTSSYLLPMQGWSPLSNIGIGICSSAPTLLLYLSVQCCLMYFVSLEQIGFYLGRDVGKVIKKHVQRFSLFCEISNTLVYKYILYTQPSSFVNAKANQIQDFTLNTGLVINAVRAIDSRFNRRLLYFKMSGTSTCICLFNR